MEFNKHKKILFIGHEATRTGAPMSLFRIMNWLKNNTDFELNLLLKTGGELSSDYKKISTVFLLELLKPTVPSLNLFQKGVNRILFFFLNRNVINKKIARIVRSIFITEFDYEKRQNELLFNYFRSVDLIFNNTSANGEILQLLSVLNKPTISRIAEMKYSIQTHFNNSFLEIKKQTNLFFAVSQSVKKDLVYLGVSADKIKLLYGSIVPIKPSIDKLFSLHKKLSLPKKSFIVMASGTRIYRKGVDLFIQIALQTIKQKNDIHFVWLGGNSEGGLGRDVSYDINNLQTSQNIHMLDAVHNPFEYYEQSDVFLMTSREDPFPLVNLEVGMFQKPIICFSNSGGSEELIDNDINGYVVPYLDVEEMSKKIISLYENPFKTKEMGVKLYEKIKKNYTIDSSGQIVLNEINKILN